MPTQTPVSESAEPRSHAHTLTHNGAGPRDNSQAGPLPLVIGITGHRDLRDEDLPALERQVEAILTGFQERYPHTPLVLLSPLAEGADRLAARVALRCGVRLTVPLPMSREEYLKDFEAAESRAEFEALLQQADRWFELPLLPGNSAENLDQPDHRSDQYGLVGAYIVRRCQVLIALWNGLAGTGDGGTWQIVQFQREGIPARFDAALGEATPSAGISLDPAEIGPVYQIVTPRRDHPGLEGEPLSLRRHFAGTEEEQAKSEATFARVCANIDAFNQNALLVESHPALRAMRDQSAEYLLPARETARLPPPLQTLRDRYAVPDALAQYYQRRTLRTLVQLCGLVFTAGLSFELGAKLHNDWLVLLLPALLLVTYGHWYVTVRKGHWQDRHQDYRALAEGLRVQFFWRLAGLPTSVADHYLRKQRSEMDWIRIAVRNLAGEPGPSAPSESPGFLDLVMKHWVHGQAVYFPRCAHRDDRELEHYEAWIKALVVASPALAALTALASLIPSPLAHWLHDHAIVHTMALVMAFVLAATAGVLHTYVDKRALSQHAKQYERMGTLFAQAEARLNRSIAAGQQSEAQHILLELGKEALAENGDWLLTHRDRPVDVPHAG